MSRRSAVENHHGSPHWHLPLTLRGLMSAPEWDIPGAIEDEPCARAKLHSVIFAMLEACSRFGVPITVDVLRQTTR